MTRATNGASAALTWPVPQPRSPTTQSALGERGERGQVEAIAEQLVAQAIPLAGGRREKLLRLGAPLAKRALQPPLILRRGRRRPTCSRTSSQSRRADESSVSRPRHAGVRTRVEGRVIVYRLLVPSARDATQPLSASAFRWRLTVDCGSCMTPQSSDTVSSWRSSSSRMRLRVVSASDGEMIENCRRASIHPYNRMEGYYADWQLDGQEGEDEQSAERMRQEVALGWGQGNGVGRRHAIRSRAGTDVACPAQLEPRRQLELEDPALPGRWNGRDEVELADRKAEQVDAERDAGARHAFARRRRRIAGFSPRFHATPPSAKNATSTGSGPYMPLRQRRTAAAAGTGTRGCRRACGCRAADRTPGTRSSPSAAHSSRDRVHVVAAHEIRVADEQREQPLVLAAATVAAVVHDAGGKRVERGRHEVAAVVGEQAREVDRCRTSAPLRSGSAVPAPGSSRRSSTCRRRARPTRCRASAARQPVVSSCLRRRAAARCCSENACVCTIWSNEICVTPPWNSTRCARLNGYATMPAALRSVWRKMIVCSISAGSPSTVVQAALDAAAQVRHLSADDAPVPAAGLVEVDRPARRCS